MKVSVIIPTYNEEESIGDCLLSLQSQNIDSYEIVVVDDGSTDKTVDIVKKFNDVKLFTQGHRGAGAARNLGTSKSQGEILVFVDADMTFDKDFLKNLIKPINLPASGVGRTIIGTFSKEEYLANKDNVWARCWNLNRGLPPDKMHPQNYPDYDRVFRAISKEYFDRAGGFDESAGYTDDYSLSQKLGTMAVAAPNAIFYHKNPGTLKEVFIQSKWMAKRKYRLGLLGYLVALARVSLPISLVIGAILALRHQILEFIIFKVVSDFGQFIGILEYLLGGKVSK